MFKKRNNNASINVVYLKPLVKHITVNFKDHIGCSKFDCEHYRYDKSFVILYLVDGRTVHLALDNVKDFTVEVDKWDTNKKEENNVQS